MLGTGFLIAIYLDSVFLDQSYTVRYVHHPLTFLSPNMRALFALRHRVGGLGKVFHRICSFHESTVICSLAHCCFVLPDWPCSFSNKNYFGFNVDLSLDQVTISIRKIWKPCSKTFSTLSSSSWRSWKKIVGWVKLETLLKSIPIIICYRSPETVDWWSLFTGREKIETLLKKIWNPKSVLYCCAQGFHVVKFLIVTLFNIFFKNHTAFWRVY